MSVSGKRSRSKARAGAVNRASFNFPKGLGPLVLAGWLVLGWTSGQVQAQTFAPPAASPGLPSAAPAYDPPGRGGSRPGFGRRVGTGIGIGVGVGIGLGILDALTRGATALPTYEEPYPQADPLRPRPLRPRPPVYVDLDDDDVDPRPPRGRRDPDRLRYEREIPARISPPAGPGRPSTAANRTPSRAPSPISVPPAAERRFVADEVLVEVRGGVQNLAAIARRHRLTLLSTERFNLAQSTVSRFRIEGGRSARSVLTQMRTDRRIATAQPNYLYTLQQDATASPKPDISPPDIAPPDLPEAVPVLTDIVPALAQAGVVAAARQMKPQYVLDRIGIEAAHRLARGERIAVAVIDTGIDRQHPELQGARVRTFDALASAGSATGDAGASDPATLEHGTAMSGAIFARASLQGIAPAAELLSARAFSGGGRSGAEGTTLHILKSLDWAASEGARVVNLSFAGPRDTLLSRSLEGARSRNMIAVAAAGNGGPKAAALYPGADPNVIAVTATDADDKAYADANRGAYVAVAAPGVDVLAAGPGEAYVFSSGTSIAAAHVTGLVALLLERRPDLDASSIRAILSDTAIDLGAKGKDPVFGAGRIDAAAALARLDTLRAGATAPKR